MDKGKEEGTRKKGKITLTIDSFSGSDFFNLFFTRDMACSAKFDKFDSAKS